MTEVVRVPTKIEVVEKACHGLVTPRDYNQVFFEKDPDIVTSNGINSAS